MIKISVIVPVYKTEAFIERCARALFSQTLKEVEFIFVDDASPDKSIEIVEGLLAEDFPDRKQDVIILHNAANKGASISRNEGLAQVKGEYVHWCDSDDWMEPDMLEKLYSAAKERDADIAYCDFFLSFEKNERYMSNPRFDTAEEMLKRGFLSGRMKYNLWNKIARRSLYEKIGIVFPEGHSMGEDMAMIRVAAVANKTAYVPEALYHYVKLNEEAYSNTFTPKKLEDTRYNVALTESFLKEIFGDSLDKEISLFKLSIKLPFLMTGDKKMYDLWREWYPESDKYANANPDLPKRTRLLQLMAARGQWWYVNMYYKVVYKFIYGFIYK